MHFGLFDWFSNDVQIKAPAIRQGLFIISIAVPQLLLHNYLLRSDAQTGWVNEFNYIKLTWYWVIQLYINLCVAEAGDDCLLKYLGSLTIKTPWPWHFTRCVVESHLEVAIVRVGVHPEFIACLSCYYHIRRGIFTSVGVSVSNTVSTDIIHCKTREGWTGGTGSHRHSFSKQSFRPSAHIGCYVQRLRWQQWRRYGSNQRYRWQRVHIQGCHIRDYNRATARQHHPVSIGVLCKAYSWDSQRIGRCSCNIRPGAAIPLLPLIRKRVTCSGTGRNTEDRITAHADKLSGRRYRDHRYRCIIHPYGGHTGGGITRCIFNGIGNSR